MTNLFFRRYLVESNRGVTELILNNGKVVKVLANAKHVKKCIIIAQYQLRGAPLEFEEEDKEVRTEHLVWLAAQTNASREISRAMKNMEETTGIQYIEELTEYDFLKVHMIGKATWLDFVRLRGY